MARVIRCKRYDCFQNLCGNSCKILNNGYKDDKCPFYKTDEQAEKDRQAAHQRLVDLGRYDLIEQYEYNSLRRW